MALHYDTSWLIERFNQGEQINWLFFWGHTNKSGEEAGKFCFSQWYDTPFTVDGILYKTAEHWMMAQKALLFNDRSSFQTIIETETAKQAKALGRKILFFNEETWNAKRFEIVKVGNIHKFNQHSRLADYLLKTDDQVLVEASPVDTIWGIGLSADSQNADNPHFWRGLNLLGFALMEVRDFLRGFGHFTKFQPSIEVPWKLHPDIHPYEIFWRMGVGEDAALKFAEYYAILSDREKLILKLTRPAPYDWERFYDD